MLLKSMLLMIWFSVVFQAFISIKDLKKDNRRPEGLFPDQVHFFRSLEWGRAGRERTQHHPRSRDLGISGATHEAQYVTHRPPPFSELHHPGAWAWTLRGVLVIPEDPAPVHGRRVSRPRLTLPIIRHQFLTPPTIDICSSLLLIACAVCFPDQSISLTMKLKLSWAWSADPKKWSLSTNWSSPQSV